MGKIIRRGGMLLALGGLFLGLAGRAEAYFHYPKEPPHVQVPPPEVTGGPECDHHHHHCHDGCGGTPPGGGTQNAPEPASLVSGLIGAGLLSFYARRRKQAA